MSPKDARVIIEGRQMPTRVYRPGSTSTVSSTRALAASISINPSAFSIASLADALENDVDKIYQYVKNYIDFTPTFGSQKGAWGCLVDRMGNAFDQAALMVELLTEAGYTADFLYGELELSPAEIGDWIGTDPTNVWASYNMLANGGIPVNVIWDSGAFVYRLYMSHVWVRVDIGGTNYVFDPAYKTYDVTAAIDLETALGYNATSFESSCLSGSTVTSDYVQDINTANLQTELEDMADNLRTWIQTNDPDATVNDIIGGRTIVPETGTIRDTSLSYENGSVTPTVWSSIPSTYKTTMRVQYDTIDETFYSKDIHGKRLTLFFNGSHEAELRLDGTLIDTSSAQTPGSWNSVWLEVVHPYPTTFADEGHWQTVWEGHPYLIAQAWGNAGRKMIEFHQSKLVENRFDGGADTDEDVFGQSLSILWHTWNAQKSWACDVFNRMTNCVTVLHHQTGLVGHYDTPLTDLGGIVWASSALDNDWDNVDTNDTSLAMHGIAFEEGVIDQSGVGGVSTTPLLDLANANGDKIYDADSSNWTSGVEPNLTNYDSGTLTDIENWWINYGWRVAIPEDGDLTKGSWNGYGYYAISPYYGAIGIINGTKGGGGDSSYSQANMNTQYGGQTTGGRGNGQPASPSSYGSSWIGNPTNSGVSKDPVGLVAGQFLYDHVDLSVGSGQFPYGLTFQRMYNSSYRMSNGVLGLGWTHNHEFFAKKGSSGLPGMGVLNPIQGAAGIVQMYVTVDMYRDLTKPLDKWVIVAIANKWLTDALHENVVSFGTPEGVTLFVKLPDGSYVCPFDNASTMSLSGGAYTLTTPQGVEYNFNSDGTIATIDYPNGPTVTYTYTSGKLTGISNGMGRALTLTYTSDKLTSVSDGNGRSVSFSYDVDDNLEIATDAESEDTTFDYDQPGRMTKIYKPANPTSPIVTNTYDSLNRVKEQKDAYDNVTTLYLAGHRSEEKDPAGYSIVRYHNAQGKVIRAADQLGNETTFEYDGLQRLLKITHPEGNSIEYEYDENNNVTQVTSKAKSGSGLSDIVNSYTYNSTWNKVATATNSQNKTTSYTYDAYGNLTEIERPTINTQTPTVTMTYNARGQMLTREDETGIVTAFTYDSTTEVLETVVVDYGMGQLNLTTTYDYDSVGNVISVTDPRGNETTYEFDDLRRLTLVTSPSPFGYNTKFTYDENSNRTKVERETGDMTTPWQTSQATFTLDDLVASIIDPGSNTTSFAYNNRRLLYTTTDAASRVTTKAYDELGRISTITDPASNVQVTNTYTDNGRLETIEDANGNITEYQYDGFDRLKKTIFPDTTYEQITYTSCGKIASRLTRAGDTIAFDYDDLGRVIEKAPDSMPTVSYEYDLANRLKKVITSVVSGNPASGEFEYFYDTAGRRVKEEYPDGKQVQYQLDENGNVTRLTYPDSYYVDRVYDELNRLTDIKLNGSTSSTLEFNYDQLDRRTTLTYDNGVVTDYTFQWDNDLESLEQTFNGSSVEFSYGFNSVHEVTSQGVDDGTFMWHPASGGTVSYGTPTDLNQYPTVGGDTYTYDDNGCLTDDDTWTFGYDTENHLVSADDGSTSASYIYDPMHRQAQKEVNSTKTRYIHDGMRIIAEYDGSGNFVKRYVYGVSLDEVLLEIDGSNDVTYLHHDRMGSVIATTDDTGAVVNTYAYSPSGECSSMSGTTFGFTGQRFDSETGLYMFKNRYYSPVIGRFLQPDPVGYKDGLNLYQYAYNNPNGFTDPLGLGADNSSLRANTTASLYDLEQVLKIAAVMGCVVDNLWVIRITYLLLRGTNAALNGTWDHTFTDCHNSQTPPPSFRFPEDLFPLPPAEAQPQTPIVDVTSPERHQPYVEARNQNPNDEVPYPGESVNGVPYDASNPDHRQHAREGRNGAAPKPGNTAGIIATLGALAAFIGLLYYLTRRR
ncbi:MAG: hypothetical protein KC777_15065 [Cyanobacteria bacterium HKST-UBA02]|nr:hypothetical protein [Cyanobacteria bacterium HKST-UBA02]